MAEYCRSCGSSIERFFSLGRMPLANALLSREDLGREESRYPLELAFCRACTLVQLVETVPPEAMFTTYDYLSSCCPPVEAQAAEVANRVYQQYTPQFVVEIGSNDGYLLSHYPESVRKLGIEPAWNVLQKARQQRQVPTLWEFFSAKVAKLVVDLCGQADVIHANNVLAHCPELNDFMAGIALLLKPGGVCEIEVPWVKDMIENGDFTSIYHEHVFYFSLLALNSLVVRHGLRIGRTEHIAAQGGSLRLWITTGGAIGVGDLMIQEANSGAHTLAFYQGLAIKAHNEILNLCGQIDIVSGRVVGFGAPAKATILLNQIPVREGEVWWDWLDYTVDDTPEKQGKFIPGVRLPIYPVSRLLEDKPSTVVVLCWNHRAAVIERLKREGWRGSIIIPLPKVEVLNVR